MRGPTIDSVLRKAGATLDETPADSALKIQVYAPQTYNHIVDYVLREILGEVGDV